MMLIGIVGKPSSGKSTFFKAATLVDVAISPRPFTTIKPNRGVAAVRTKCPCRELGLTCSPKHGSCIGGKRFVPIEILDVAGLVPGAHEGKGLGNQFLTDLARAHCLIHVVDASGRTDPEGNETRGHDPASDVRFLEEELDYWFLSILEKNWRNIERRAKTEKMQEVLSDILSGLNISSVQVSNVLTKHQPSPTIDFARTLRKLSKPMIIAANKMDLPESPGNFQKLREVFKDLPIVPVSSQGELALRQAALRGLIEYLPGDGEFSGKGNLTKEQETALGFIREKVLLPHGSTGVEQVLEEAAFSLLKQMVVFPVENEGKFSDKAGNVLPDAIILPKGSNPKDLAGAIHSDLASHFLFALDARKKMRISADHALADGDIVKIVSSK